MKYWNKLIPAAVLLLILTSCSSSTSSTGQSEKTIKWKMGHISDANHIWNKTALRFAELVKEKTDGKIEIDVYPNSQLGGETDTLNSIKGGTVDLTITGETMQNWAPKTALLAVPYAIENEEHLNRVINGKVGREIEKDIKENLGATPLFYMQRAPRNLTSNKPIKTPEDLKGFSMRVPNVPLFMNAWEKAGAKPQVMDLSEVFTGLQQHVIQGQENPYDLIYSSGLYEVQKYANETEHVYSWIYVIIGNDQYNELTEDLKAEVQEAAKEAQAYGDQLFQKEIAQYKQKLIDEGMEINTEVDKKAFQKAMLPAIKETLSKEQYDLYKEMINE
ncbi:TRAP transporter substrate-binding protein [Metabacillus arenae]|uniref:TRAP transporter substrate-binding protein n=1 Tax=Metabacillus arenae TaxID=2771434 RepID=A0A926NBY2_9BACI|nr:TRAP transporter substrate-binding protein [Metabacillus arenae]MBD1381442.1 TRAP transporter substrate-binding protein [Metabacillus arenae]